MSVRVFSKPAQYNIVLIIFTIIMQMIIHVSVLQLIFSDLCCKIQSYLAFAIRNKNWYCCSRLLNAQGQIKAFTVKISSNIISVAAK